MNLNIYPYYTMKNRPLFCRKQCVCLKNELNYSSFFQLRMADAKIFLFKAVQQHLFGSLFPFFLYFTIICSFSPLDKCKTTLSKRGVENGPFITQTVLDLLPYRRQS